MIITQAGATFIKAKKYFGITIVTEERIKNQVLYAKLVRISDYAFRIETPILINNIFYIILFLTLQ